MTGSILIGLLRGVGKKGVGIVRGKFLPLGPSPKLVTATERLRSKSFYKDEKKYNLGLRNIHTITKKSLPMGVIQSRIGEDI
jgi:hypothetical protein